MSFAAEPYGVFVDDLVSGLTGGEVREELVFLPENAPFLLGFARDFLADTVRIHGLVEGVYFRFHADTDFKMTPAGAVDWLAGDPGVPRAGAHWPDRGSRFYVSYERKPEVRATPLLTDRNPGSMVRTLAESFAREYAVVSRQLESVYRAGFLATASGRDLEQVAALLGVTRRTRTFAAGEVVFSRATPAPGDIFIPAGTQVSTGEAPLVTVETTDARTLRAGTVSVAVPVSSLVAGPEGVAAPRTLAVIHRPILGVDAVSNPQAMVFGAADESDEALRRRAERALETGGRATMGALVGALLTIEGVREQDLRLVEDHLAFPGTVKLTIAANLDEARARRAVELINEHRPAGVRVLHNLNVPPDASLPPGGDSGGSPPGPLPPGGGGVTTSTRFPVGVRALVTPASASLAAAQKAALKAKVEDALRAALGAYGIGEHVVYNHLIAAAMDIEGVYDVSLDLYLDDGSAPTTGRTNLIPLPPDTRAELKTLTVTLRGALIALDIAVDVQRLGLSASADSATALAAARDDIGARLAAFVSSPARPDSLDDSTLLGALTATADYRVNALSYVAEFLDDGLRVLKPNVVLTPDAEQQLWIRNVSVIEGATL